MEMIFRKSYTIENNSADRFGKLRTSMILSYAQDAATSHCAHLGLDWNTMAAKGMFWAVTRTRVQVERMPQRGEKITVETWPMPTTRVAYPRAMAMYSENGELLLRMVSLWVLVDMEKRTMILPGKSGVDVDGILRGNELKPPAGLAPASTAQGVSRAVAYTDLDVNGHLNNARYLDWVDDLTDSEFHRTRSLKEMTLCYSMEAREGEVLDLGWVTEGDTLCTEFNRDGHRVFAAKMELSVM